ncbi:unnamed protein product, partial [marine sediment metagenome]
IFLKNESLMSFEINIIEEAMTTMLAPEIANMWSKPDLVK